MVTSNGSLAPGDLINVIGTTDTISPDDVNDAERCISATSLTRISSGTPLTPFAMTCLSVGGNATGLQPGVEYGVGLNNTGLLVKIAGKVTYTDSVTVVVDDGSSGSGAPIPLDVLVDCPTGAPTSVNVGNTVIATGIVEGYIPAGLTYCRRCIRLLSMRVVH